MTTINTSALTTEDAELLISAAAAAAETAGVSVLDAGGHLLGFRRDDRAVLISGETSTPEQDDGFAGASLEQLS